MISHWITNKLKIFLLGVDEDDEGNYDSAYFPGDHKKKRSDEHDVVEQTENPYYGDDPEMGQGDSFVQTTDNPYYGGDVEIAMDAIKTSDNPYYGGEPDLAPPPHAMNVKDNPYYEGGPDASDEHSDSNDGNIERENVTVSENPYYGGI